jgi:hypothetical protein
MRRFAACLILVLLLVATTGCGEQGPRRYRLSGAVLLDGKPIAAGQMVFTPDSAVKNSGPQGVAEIHDGRYDTALAGGKGIAGGPTVIRVTGLSGAGGKLLCDQEMTVDLPRADSTHDINLQGTTAPPRAVKEI